LLLLLLLQLQLQLPQLPRLTSSSWSPPLKNMMAEISSRGPITCTIGCPETLENYTGGVYKDLSGDKSPDHDIEVTGYGTENGVDYWHVRNSWGVYWGEQGWFRIVRGVDNLGIESQECSWAVPTKVW